MTNVRLVKTGIQDVFARIRIMKTSAEKAVLRGYAVDHNGVRCNNCRELQHFFKRSDTSLAFALQHLAGRIAAEYRSVNKP